MRLKGFCCFSIFWYGLLLCLGFHLLEVQTGRSTILSNFWFFNGHFLANYNAWGKYFAVWAISPLITGLIVLALSAPKTKWRKVHLLLCGFFTGLFVFLCWSSNFFQVHATRPYWPMNRTLTQAHQIWWQLSGASLILSTLFLLLERRLIAHKASFIKFFFGLQALVYLGLLGVGFYYWEIAYLTDRPNFRLMSDVVAVNAYHNLLILSSFISFIIALLLTSLGRWRAFFQLAAFALFSYSVFVHSDSIRLSMTNLAPFWITGCSLLVLCSVIIYRKNNKAIPLITTIHSDPLLDDLSNLT